jgi:hypothetical protein
MENCEKTINVSYPDTEPCEIKSSSCVIVPTAISYLGIEQGENATLVITKLVQSLMNTRSRLKTVEETSELNNSIKVSLTSEQLKNIGTTPIEVIPEPGVGKLIEVRSAFSKITFVSTAFDSNEILLSYKDGSSIWNHTTNFLSATETKIETALLTDREIVENKAVQVTGTDSSATGDGTVDIYITYRIVTL